MREMYSNKDVVYVCQLCKREECTVVSMWLWLVLVVVPAVMQSVLTVVIALCISSQDSKESHMFCAYRNSAELDIAELNIICQQWFWNKQSVVRYSKGFNLQVSSH